MNQIMNGQMTSNTGYYQDIEETEQIKAVERSALAPCKYVCVEQTMFDCKSQIKVCDLSYMIQIVSCHGGKSLQLTKKFKTELI